MAVLATSGVAVWSAWQSAKLARETRGQQRLAESYLEVLRIVEREGQWVEASIRNWEIAAEEAKAVVDPDARGHVAGFERVKVPEPAVTDQATITAHLAAFGSDDVRRLYRAWRSTIAEIVKDDAVLKVIADDSYPDGPSLHHVKHLREELHPNELRARQALPDAIAEELGR